MKKSFKTTLILVFFIIMSILNSNAQKDPMNNILLEEWKGPYEGVPAFNKMKVKAIKPAMQKAIKLHLAEIDKITNNPETPTFENTLIPFEKSGDAIQRVFTYYGIFSSNKSSPEFREVQQDLSSEISAYSSKISQNEKLFSRIEKIYKDSQKKPLKAQEQRVLDLIYEEFVMEGAALNAEDKQSYAEINKELSELYTEFSNNVLAEEENYVVFLEEDQLGGLPDSYVNSAKRC